MNNTGFSPETLHLIGASLAVHKVERIDASITPLPGTGRVIVVGTRDEIERPLEVVPRAKVDHAARRLHRAAARLVLHLRARPWRALRNAPGFLRTQP